MSRWVARVACAVALAGMASACGDRGLDVQSPVVGPSTQPTAASSTPIDGRCMIPPAPASPRAEVRGGSVMFTWSPVTAASEYVVAVGTTPGGSQTLFTGTASTSYEWGAVAGSYYARVHAHTRCGTSEPSSEMSVVVQGL